MTLQEAMKSLESMGNPQTFKTWTNHGAQPPYFGVKVGDMKIIVKKVKKDHDLALGLFDTGNADAMYLAGLIADEEKMTKKNLDDWAKKANWYMISEFAIAAVAAESKHGFDLADKWIKSNKENIASAGWATWSSMISTKANDELDMKKLKSMIDHVTENIHDAQNRVRYTMNGFVISAGGYIEELTDYALKAGEKIGKVYVNVGNTACKVPVITEYIPKMLKRGTISKKRKVSRC